MHFFPTRVTTSRLVGVKEKIIVVCSLGEIFCILYFFVFRILYFVICNLYFVFCFMFSALKVKRKQICFEVTFKSHF